MDAWAATGLFVAEFAIRVLLAVVVLLRRRRHGSATMAWVVLIVAVPVGGVVLYLLLGEVRLGDRRRRAHDEIQERTNDVCAQHWAGAGYPELDPRYQPIAILAENVGGTAPRGGNRLTLEGDTDRAIDLLVADIDAAREHCHLLYYIYLDDGAGQRVADALIRAAGRGVECRLLVDDVGSRGFLESSLTRRLRSNGVRVVGALPVSVLRTVFARLDLRNHRKLAVIDGRIGHTGSQNVADASFAPKKHVAPWIDATIRIEGPAVRDLQAIFVADWYLDTEESLEGLLALAPESFEDGMPVQILATGPGSKNSAVSQAIQASFHLAREEVILTTPYFVPDAATSASLQTAAQRGVQTTLVVPRHNDSPLVSLASRSYYDELLEAGVELWEFTGGLLHSKTLTIDRNLAFVSTANLDRRSFELNFEVSTFVYDSDFASQLRMLQKGYLDGSERIRPLEWRRRSMLRRMAQNAAGLTSPLL